MGGGPVGVDRTFLGRLIGALRRIWRGVRREVRSQATGILAWEQRELENLFALMVFSPLVGIPGSPSLLSLALMPLAERELMALLDRARESGDPLGELFSLFEVT
jgi:hypothetical protein